MTAAQSPEIPEASLSSDTENVRVHRDHEAAEVEGSDLVDMIDNLWALDRSSDLECFK